LKACLNVDPEISRVPRLVERETLIVCPELLLDTVTDETLVTAPPYEFALSRSSEIE